MLLTYGCLPLPLLYVSIPLVSVMDCEPHHPSTCISSSRADLCHIVCALFACSLLPLLFLSLSLSFLVSLFPLPLPLSFSLLKTARFPSAFHAVAIPPPNSDYSAGINQTRNHAHLCCISTHTRLCFTADDLLQQGLEETLASVVQHIGPGSRYYCRCHPRQRLISHLPQPHKQPHHHTVGSHHRRGQVQHVNLARHTHRCRPCKDVVGN